MSIPAETIAYTYLSSSNRLGDALNRVTQVVIDSVTVAEYRYNGLGHVVSTDLPEPDVMWNLHGSSSGSYPDLDRFNRPVSPPPACAPEQKIDGPCLMRIVNRIWIVAATFVVSLINSGCLNSPQRRGHEMLQASLATVTPQESMDWGTHVELARMIERLPIWPMEGDFTAEQWEYLLGLAVAFQKLPVYDIKVVLEMYMSWKVVRDKVPMTLSEYDSKPMLLLRIMFNTHESRTVGPPFLACGGLSYTTQDKNAVLADLPFKWTENRPALVAHLKPGGGGSGGPGYQPHLEYEYLREWTSFRDMTNVAANPTLKWEDFLQ